MRVHLGQHCDDLAKLCLLEIKVGLHLVESTEHLAFEALCLLQDRDEGTADPKALAFPENLPTASVFPENRGRSVSIVTKNNLCN